jgi:hypothetical protein
MRETYSNGYDDLEECVHACGRPTLMPRPDSVEELEPIVARLRQRWPAVRIRLRGDAGFCREKLMAWCEREDIDFIFGLAQNPRLKKLIAAPMTQAENQYQETQAPARVFSEFSSIRPRTPGAANGA